MIPANNEVIRMLNLASATYIGLAKESIPMNMDIVNPIPASKPTPNICIQLAPRGSELIFNLLHKYEVTSIPIGLPTNNPNPIPKPKLFVSPLIILDSSVILVLANANRGIIEKLTGFTKACSNLSKGDSTAVSLVGIVIATKTPAIVA